MPDAPKDSPKFLKAYLEAAEGTKLHPAPSHAAGSLGWAIRAYFASEEYKALAALTRQQRKRILEAVEAEYGRAPYAGVQPKHIRTDLAKLDAHPANNRLKCWRALFKWLHLRGMIDADPASQVLPRKAPKSDGHTAWERSDLETFRGYWPHGTPQRLCMELLYRSCAAMVDACRIGPGMVNAGWLTMTRSKSGSLAVIPWAAANAPDWFEWTDDLELSLGASPRHMTYIVTAGGKPRSEKSTSQWFSKACRDAGLENGKSAHGLRKLRASMFRENGASEDQRKAILGHETSAEAAHYSKSADMRRVISGTDFPTPASQSSKSAPK